jgi:signal recognition particle subunit SRP54
MGSLKNVIAMLPGVPKELKDAEIDEKDIDRIEAIISSMTMAERRDPSLINGSRRARIARGSGVTIQDVNGLLKQFKQVKSMMRSAGKGRRGRMPKLPAGMDLSELGLE